MSGIVKPSVADMITALKIYATEDPQKEYLCQDCYLYPFSKDGHMSTGRTCFEHLVLDVAAKLQEQEAELAIDKSGDTTNGIVKALGFLENAKDDLTWEPDKAFLRIEHAIWELRKKLREEQDGGRT